MRQEYVLLGCEQIYVVDAGATWISKDGTRTAQGPVILTCGLPAGHEQSCNPLARRERMLA